MGGVVGGVWVDVPCSQPGIWARTDVEKRRVRKVRVRVRVRVRIVAEII